MPLRLPKRLFNVKTMKVEIYADIQHNVRKKRYVCISHVWGPMEEYNARKLGIVSGVDWKIPLSDPKKLQRIKEAVLYYDMKYCWLDIVCIPQGDDRLDERAEEIPHMGDYYNGADMTLVMATKEQNTSSAFFRKIAAVSAGVIVYASDSSVKSMQTSYDTIRSSVYKEEWFTRVWTFQEAIFSRDIKYVAFDDTYYDLTAILNRLYDNHEIITLYGDIGEHLSVLSYAIAEYNKSKTDYAEIMSKVSLRQCAKPHDMLYGVLSILRYTTFHITYEISLEELSYEAVKYAHDEGDISWLSMIGNKEGFIIPIGERVWNVGKYWTPIRYKTVVIFRDEILMLNVCYIGYVEYTKRYRGKDSNTLGWLVRTFKDWGICNKQILHMIVGYRKTDRELRMLMDETVDSLEDMDETNFYGSAVLLQKNLETRGMYQVTPTNYMNINIAVIVNDYYDRFPLLIVGKVDIGDKFVLLPMKDYYNRTLGIITDRRRKKGVCLYKMNYEREYNIYEHIL